MKKTKNKWDTFNCGHCGDHHIGYTGKLDANGKEYVICGTTQKKIPVPCPSYIKQ